MRKIQIHVSYTWYKSLSCFMHLKLVGRQWTEGSDYLWLVSYAILASSENVSRAPLSTLDTPLGSEFKV